MMRCVEIVLSLSACIIVQFILISLQRTCSAIAEYNSVSMTHTGAHTHTHTEKGGDREREGDRQTSVVTRPESLVTDTRLHTPGVRSKPFHGRVTTGVKSRGRNLD